MTKEQIEQFLDSPEAASVFTLAAYAIAKTPSKVDDELVDNIADYSGIIVEKIKLISALEPTDKDAKKAAIVILEKIASMTETKYDDLIVSIAKRML